MEPKQMGVVAAAALALLLGIVGTAVPEMAGVKQKTGSCEQKSTVGLFKSTVTFDGCTGSKDKTEDVKCDAEDQKKKSGGKATDCDKAQDSKCKTTKAFGILAVLGGAAGAATIAVTALGVAQLPAVAVAGANGFACFCYMIVWAIFAQLTSNDADDSAGCGFDVPAKGGSEGVDVKLGASAALYIVAWLLHGGLAVYSFTAAKSE